MQNHKKRKMMGSRLNEQVVSKVATKICHIIYTVYKRVYKRIFLVYCKADNKGNTNGKLNISTKKYYSNNEKEKYVWTQILCQTSDLGRLYAKNKKVN